MAWWVTGCNAVAVSSSDLWDVEMAEWYDDGSAFTFAPDVLDPAVDFLAELAGEGPALELAIRSDLLRNDLVDELYAMVGPKLIGSDKPAFAGVPVTDLHLLGVRQFDDSQSVVLHYAVASRGGRGDCRAAECHGRRVAFAA